MKSLRIDIETFSSVNLAKAGVYRYVQAPDFEVLLLGYSMDGRPVQVVDLARGEKIPDEIQSAIKDEAVTKWAFNANFERICLSRYLGLPAGEYLNPSSWKCSMVWAATMGLPLSLEGVGTVLQLDKQKLTEGKDLIRYFCQPCTPTAVNGQRTRNLPQHAPDKWATFKRYNARDVETEMAVQEKLSKFPVPDSIWEEYHLDQEINDRGVGLDMKLVRNAISVDSRSRAQLTAAMKHLTDLENPNSVQQMKQWLADNGMETDTLGKKAVVELLKTAPIELADALSLRQQLARSSVRKYQAMENAVCNDGRARGMFQFFGANRTGRWAGRLIQMQNLPQNHLDDLAEARALVRCGDFEALEMLYEDVPDTLSQLIRTAFVAKSGTRFFVADFSAIEARVIAWLAGEQWRQDVFTKGGDIYCASASQMFKVPVEKHGVNGHLRQKGKVAELACIAEGSLVLTDQGLIPIERVTITMRLWDGCDWVKHEGVIYKRTKEVIEYEGLRATPDHLVWVEGKAEPVQFGDAAASGAHLVQTGDGWQAIRLGEDYQPREALGSELAPLPSTNRVHWVWKHAMAEPSKHSEWKIKRLPALFSKTTSTDMAPEAFDGSEMSLRKSKRQRLFKIRCPRYSVQFPFCATSWNVDTAKLSKCEEGTRTRPHQQQWKLRTRQPKICPPGAQPGQPAENSHPLLQSNRVAIWPNGRIANAKYGNDQGGDLTFSGGSGRKAKEKLAHNLSKARLYDIRNAGPRNRYTVSGKLVHNCGYGGSVGALKAMGALEMGLQEHELSGLIQQWRSANPNIVRLWWDVDRAVKTCISERKHTEIHGITFSFQSGMLFITLPSGRRLAYVKPRIGENQFGGQCITYEGVGGTKKWDRLDSYGPKFVENIVQATARDILSEAMLRLNASGYQIVMHVHDEVVIEAPETARLADVCAIMGQTPSWAEGLLLRADGYVTDFYKKD